MFVRQLLGLATTLAVFSGCGEAPTIPQPLEGLGSAGPSFGINGHGSGPLAGFRFDPGWISSVTSPCTVSIKF